MISTSAPPTVTPDSGEHIVEWEQALFKRIGDERYDNGATLHVYFYGTEIGNVETLQVCGKSFAMLKALLKGWRQGYTLYSRRWFSDVLVCCRLGCYVGEGSATDAPENCERLWKTHKCSFLFAVSHRQCRTTIASNGVNIGYWFVSVAGRAAQLPHVHDASACSRRRR